MDSAFTAVESKKVVFIGGFGHEGVDASLKALGYDGISMALDKVGHKTWAKRADIIHDYKDRGLLAATVLYLHTSLLLKASRGEFRESFLRILSTARQCKMIIFVYQDNLDGVFSRRNGETREPLTVEELDLELAVVAPDAEIRRMRLESTIARLMDYENRKHEVDDFIRLLYESDAQVVPFFVRSDVTIRLHEFFNDLEQGVFLRLFVPDDRLQAEQLRSLLSVLERFLRQVEGQDFSIDSQKSEKGTVYLFRSGTTLNNLDALNEAFARFDHFMKLCGDDPSSAQSLLSGKGIKPDEAAFVVDKYSREYRRLILDARHELERKTLVLKQRLETEIVEAGAAPALSWSNETPSGLVSAVATGGSVSINIGNVSVVNADRINTEVQQVIGGSISYNQNDLELIELFQRHADPLEALQCRSDLDQLKDKSISQPSRQNAKQRLVGFLRKAAIKGGEVVEKVAVETLSKYLETLLRGA